MAKLEIEIGAITTGLSKGLREANSKLQAFGKQAQDVGKTLSKNISAPIAAIGAAAFASSVKLGNFADTLLDLEQQTGLSTDALQKYRAVTLEAGIATDAVARASENLQRRLASGEEGSADLTAGLNALGISARDASGNLRSIDAVLEEAINSLADIEDITIRNNLALKVFGRSASELAPLLALGSAGIENAKKRAEELGFVLSKEALEAANKFRIEFDTLTASFGVVTNEIGQAFLPIASKLVEIIQTKVLPVVRGFISLFNQLSPTVKTVIAVVGGLVAAIGPLVTGLGFFVTTILPALKVGLGAVTVLFTPLALKIAAITGVVVGLGLVVKGLIDSWDTVGAFFSQLWDKIKLLFINGVKNTLIAFNKFTSAVGIDFQDTIDGLEQDSKRLKTALDAEPAVKLGDVFSEIGGNIKKTFTEVKDTIVGAMGESEDAITKTAVAFQGLGGGAVVGSGRTLETAIGGGGARGDFEFDFDFNFDNLDDKILQLKNKFTDARNFIVNEIRLLSEEVNQIIEFGIENTIGDFAFSIGEAIASGADALKAAGSSLLSGLASILNQLGQLAIGAGIAIEAIRESLIALKGVKAIAAGVALVALAGVISGTSRRLAGNFGGVGSAGGGAAVGSGISQTFGGGATGFSPFVGDREIKLVAETDGAKLKYVIDQANAYQN